MPKIIQHKIPGGGTIIDVPDNDATAIDIEQAGVDYFTIDTTDSAEKVIAGKLLVAEAGVDVSGAAGITLENDETITNSTNGEVLINGTVKAGTGSGAGVYASNGNHDVTIQTGNSTTGAITITDGADGNIAITPNGSGEVDISKVDIDGGAIDGTAIGANSANSGAFTTVTASTSVDITGSAGLILENDETITNSTDGTVLINGVVAGGTGSAAGVFQSNGDNDLTLQTGNSTTGSISIVDGANGNITIAPNGSGSVGVGTTVPGTSGHNFGGQHNLTLGGITADSFSVLEVSGKDNDNGAYVGVIEFCNKENSDAGGTTSEGVTAIATKVVTDDTNAGDDSGGSLAFHTKGNGGSLTQRVVIDESGNVKFDAYGSGTLSTDGSGNITASDARLKEETRTLDDGLDMVKQLQPKYFKWREDSGLDQREEVDADGNASMEYQGTEHLGFFAQEVNAVCPEAAHPPHNPERPHNFDDRGVIAMLVKAVQELSAKVEALEGQG